MHTPGPNLVVTDSKLKLLQRANKLAIINYIHNSSKHPDYILLGETLWNLQIILSLWHLRPNKCERIHLCYYYYYYVIIIIIIVCLHMSCINKYISQHAILCSINNATSADCVTKCVVKKGQYLDRFVLHIYETHRRHRCTTCPEIPLLCWRHTNIYVSKT